MILDYEQCEKLLDSFNNTLIKETTPIGFTNLENLPIRHFTLGNGNKHIVVTASQHSNEIISTTFVIYLMKYLIKNNIYFEKLTIHFIPILNPEGYIINTSTIRNKISKDATQTEIIKYCYEFYLKYKIDSINPTQTIKLHQEMFSDTNHTSINKKFNILKDSVQEILSNHPKGSIIDWASNGNGIDLNSNSINKQTINNECNKQPQYNNIRIDIPSPIGHPGKTHIQSFKEEIEISSLKNLFKQINKNNQLIGYLNYHSIGGMIFQRPESNNNTFNIIYNYLLSKFYQEYTIKNNHKYNIITELANKITSVNDSLRIQYPGNLLIELSPMMGNPIGVFGDINNYTNTINSNINSFIYTMNNIQNIYNKSLELTKQNEQINNLYPIIDKEYITIKKKILTK